MLLQGDHSSTNLSFLNAGGEMGKLIQNKNWSQTPVGSPDQWSAVFKTTLGIVVNSRFPMVLMWGEQFTVFYNDAFRASLGENGLHPHILGENAEKAWPQRWSIIKPLIDQVLNGESVFKQDVQAPLYRNGTTEDVYWTFSYSPVINEGGKVEGVFITCNETTEKINVIKSLEEREEKYNFVIDSADLATWDMNPAVQRFSGNSRMKEWFGLADEDDFNLEEAINNISSKDRQKVTDAINNALTSSGNNTYEVNFTVSPNGKQQRQLLSKGKAVFDTEGNAIRFSGITEDITQKYGEAIKAAASENRFRNTVKQAPIGITIFTGPGFMVEMANDFYLQIVGRTEDQFVGKPLFEALPEVKQFVEELLISVYTTGIPYHGREFPVTLNRYGKKETTYFNFTYQPYRETDGSISGIIVIAFEVTDSVKAKYSLTESERQFRNMVLQSPIAMTIFRGPDHVIEIANKVLIETIWRRKEEEVIGRPALEVFPELIDQKYPELLHRVYTSGITHREKEAVAYVQGDDEMKRFYLDFEYRPLYETDGSISGIIITVNDVTEKVEARLKVEESENRLNLVIDASELGTWEWHVQTDKVNYSGRFLEMIGYDKENKPNHNDILNTFYPEDLSLREVALEEAFKTGILKYTVRTVWKDGSVHWMHVKGKVFFDDNNAPLVILKTARDITLEKHYQQELEDRERRFRVLADSLPQLVWTTDINGNVTYFNESAYKYSGLSGEEILSDKWVNLVHPDEREENRRVWLQSVATGKPYIFEHRFVKADGESRWHLSRGIPQYDDTGEIRMWIGASTDIQEIKELDEQKDLFIGMASHELKTPVTTIKGYVQLLQSLYEEGDDIFLKDSLATIDKQIISLTSLISDLLDLSKIKTGSLHFNKENFDINEMIQQTIINTRQINPLHMIEFLPSPSAIVYGDKERLAQVLINFLTNAVKYSPDSRRILVSADLLEGNIKVSVQDFGIGINKKDQERIFERFYRVEGKNEKTFPGFGIGLFIAAEIISKHNGLIGVNSEQGKGSTFFFSIPAANI